MKKVGKTLLSAIISLVGLATFLQLMGIGLIVYPFNQDKGHMIGEFGVWMIFNAAA